MDQQEISDRLEIESLLTTYAKAVDRKNWELYRSVFTADATIDYSSAGGINAPVADAAAWIETTLKDFPVTLHQVSNIDVAFAEDRNSATVEAMLINPMVMPGDSRWITSGWYHHELVRTPDGWKSRQLTEECAFLWDIGS